MTPLKYRRRPVIVEAVQFDGTKKSAKEFMKVLGWMWAWEIDPDKELRVWSPLNPNNSHFAVAGDWGFKESGQQFGAVLNDADFRAAYEPVQEGE